MLRRNNAIGRPSSYAHMQRRDFHDYFVTHLPSSSLHPDSRSTAGPYHKLPRAASTPHTAGPRSPAAAPPMVGASRELTVVRIPLRSAKHHFGVSISRGMRPYNEDTYQAGTIEIPAFAKKAPISLSRSRNKDSGGQGTSADSASGDPQVFYFGVFDGHGGHECSDFLRDELHTYVEKAAEGFKLASSLKKVTAKAEPVVGELSPVKGSSSDGDLSAESKEEVSVTPVKSEVGMDEPLQVKEPDEDGRPEPPPAAAVPEGVEPIIQASHEAEAIELERTLVNQWRDTVGGYFRRFKPEHFQVASNERGSTSDPAQTSKQQGDAQEGNSIETVMMYAFLRADLDFVTAQASKRDDASDAPLNNDEILGSPSSQPTQRIGGPKRFKGGSTCSIAMISTPSPTPFWNPASPCSLLVAHVGDTRILLCDTATGQAMPVTTNHHPSSPIEGNRLRRYAATFVTDSFGEERMSGLANTRAFGDMQSKRIGVSAEPELRRLELAPAQYSFMVLISDGVSGTLGDQEVVDIVKDAKTPEQGAKDVVAFATEVSREGDNATCLVVRLGGWERRAEGGLGSLGTREIRDFRREGASDPRSRRT